MHTIIIDLYIEHKSFLTSISSFSSPSINQGTSVNGSYKRIRCMSYIHVVDGIHFSKCGVNGRRDGLLELMTKIIGGSLIVLHHNSQEWLAHFVDTCLQIFEFNSVLLYGRRFELVHDTVCVEKIHHVLEVACSTIEDICEFVHFQEFTG